jgi:hypothetical protein
MTPDKCNHTYGHYESASRFAILDEHNYHSIQDDGFMVRYTYCPWCRTQLHTLDGVVLGLPDFDAEDDCPKGGCND